MGSGEAMKGDRFGLAHPAASGSLPLGLSLGLSVYRPRGDASRARLDVREVRLVELLEYSPGLDPFSIVSGLDALRPARLDNSSLCTLDRQWL